MTTQLVKNICEKKLYNIYYKKYVSLFLYFIKHTRMKKKVTNVKLFSKLAYSAKALKYYPQKGKKTATVRAKLVADAYSVKQYGEKLYNK